MPWFESVAEAERRAQRTLPASVFKAIRAGTERGLTLADNVAAFSELGFAPHVAGWLAERDLSTTRDGRGRRAAGDPLAGRRAGRASRRPSRASARAAAARGTAIGLSGLASTAIEEVVAANPEDVRPALLGGVAGGDRGAGRAGAGGGRGRA